MAVTRRVCMTPSNTLSSLNASEFGRKIIEAPIVLDYLIETQALVRTLATPQNLLYNDWWDLAGKTEYVNILKRRHSKIDDDAMMKDKTLPRPDISTFEGLTPSLLGIASAVIVQKGTRSEFYEIKPNNKWGEADGTQKVADVSRSYRKYGIGGIYKPGDFYPQLKKKTIQLKGAFVDIFRYLINILLPKLRVNFISIDLEVERKYAGVLFYKICVTFNRPEEWDQRRELDWYVANFCVRNLLRANTVAQDAQTKALAMTFADALEPVEGPPPGSVPRFVADGIDFTKTPMIQLTTESIADEFANAVMTIRDTMYSRLMGQFGDRYFLCCDENYYQNVIVAPGKQKVAAQIQMLGLGTGAKVASMATMLSLLPATAQSISEIIQGSPQLLVDVVDYARTHPKETFIAIGIAVAITALVIVTVASAGTAAPATGAAAVALTEGGLAAGGTAAGGMAAGIMADTAGAAAVGTAAIPDAALVSGSGVPSLVAWARSAAAAGATASQVAQAGAGQAMDQLLTKILAEQAMKTVVEKVVVGAGLTAGLGVIGLSAKPAFASGPSGPAVNPANLGPMVSIPPLGRLFLLKTTKAFRYGVPQSPPLYKQFNIDSYAADLQIGQPSRGNAYLLGILNVQ